MLRKVLGVLAGEDMPRDLLCRWAQSAEFLIAADAGADRLMEAGLAPDVVVGDFDSIAKREDLIASVESKRTRFIRDEDQETTDCDKLLMHAQDEGISEITLAAVEGDRLDHMLSTLHSAAVSPLSVRIALRSGIGWIMVGGDSISVATRKGRTISLLPLSDSNGVNLNGVEWPLNEAHVSMRGSKSISNRAVEESISASLGEGALFLFVEVPEDELPIW